MYYGGTNQETKEQRSRKKENEEQEKWEKTILHSKGVCKKKDLIPSKEHSQPSKLLAFLSRQMHQIKQWGPNLQTSMWRCCANFLCQASNNSRTVWGITHCIPNKQKTKDHNSQAMEQWSRRWSTDSPQLLHIASVKHYHTSFTKVAIVKILPKEADQEKKATLGGTFDCHIILHGKETRLGG